MCQVKDARSHNKYNFNVTTQHALHCVPGDAVYSMFEYHVYTLDYYNYIYINQFLIWMILVIISANDTKTVRSPLFKLWIFHNKFMLQCSSQSETVIHQ